MSTNKKEKFYLDGVKSDVEFDRQLNDIINGPDRPLTKEQKIRALTGDYFNYRIMMSQRRMHDLVMKNISTLAEYTGRKVTPANISKYMGIGPTADLYEYWVNSRTITSLRSIAMISEFYGVPEEIILFKDIRAIYDKQQFEESYADIVRSHRR